MKLKAVLPAVIAFTCLLRAQNKDLKTLDEIKRWQFDVRNGRVDVKLSSYAHAGRPRNTVLSLNLQGDTVAMTVREEAELIAKVLKEMPSLGYQTRNLEVIGTPLDGSDVQEGVNLAVSESGKWRACIGRKYCYEAQKVANEYLKSVDAFKEIDSMLEGYGLRRKDVRTDDMGCGVTSNSGSAHRRATKDPPKISCSSLVLMSLGGMQQ